MNLHFYFTPAIAAGLSMLFSGCAVGPDYHPPKIATPNKWGEPMAGGETSKAQPVVAWWKTFHDPELNSLIQRAVATNLDLRVAEARVREARAQYSGAFAQLWPTLDAGGAYQRVGRSHSNAGLGAAPIPGLGAIALPNKPFQNDVYLYGFDSAWEIDVFGGTRRLVESSKAELAAAELGKRDVLVCLLGEVARNYVETRGLQSRLEIANKNIKAQEEGLALTRDRFKSGLTSELDVQQATAVLASTRSQVPVLEAGIQQSIHRLGVLLGQDPGALQSELCKPSTHLAKAPKVPVGLPSDLLRRRPDIQRAERELAAANARIGVATADLFPKFSLTGAFGGLSVSDWFSSGSRFWSFGPTVQWRIFDAGKIRANIRVQNARQEQSLALYEKSVLAAMEDVENALVSYAKEQERHRCLQQAVDANREALHLASQNYANGLANFINVLEAERSLHQAEDSLAQSDTAVLQNLVVLYKALGGGWEKEG